MLKRCGASKRRESERKLEKTEENIISDDYVMIENSFLKFLHRSWIKVVHKENENRTN